MWLVWLCQVYQLQREYKLYLLRFHFCFKWNLLFIRFAFMKLPLISHFLRNNNKQTTNQQHQRQRCQKITHGKPHSTHTQKRARHFRNKYGWATAQKNNNKETNGLKPKLFHVFSSSFYFLSMRIFFCSVPNAMFKAHPTLIAETTYTLAHPKWQAKKWPKIQLSSAIPFTMQRYYGRQKYSETQQHRTGHSTR